MAESAAIKHAGRVRQPLQAEVQLRKYKVPTLELPKQRQEIRTVVGPIAITVQRGLPVLHYTVVQKHTGPALHPGTSLFGPLRNGLLGLSQGAMELRVDKAYYVIDLMFVGHLRLKVSVGVSEGRISGWEAYKGLVEEVNLLVEDEGSGKVLEKFEKDAYFGEIVQFLVLGTVYGDDLTPKKIERAQKRAAHRAVGFEVADGKLWRIAGKGSQRAPRVECVPKEEGLALALAMHEAAGHFGRDLTILTLQDRYFWPNLRSDVITAVTSCPRCRNFGPKLMNALLAPITRSRPFDLLSGDYLSLPIGTGGFKTVLLFVDVYSRFVFRFMTKSSGTGAFSVDCLDKLCNHIMTPLSFLSDNGSHFSCQEIEEWAYRNEVSLPKPPPYTPSVNGLVEEANRILLGRLRALCAGDIGEEQDNPNRPPTPPPRSWPKFFQLAIRQMNDRILPSLGYSPRELLTGVLSADRRYKASLFHIQFEDPLGRVAWI
ncbi:hypothetical protein FRC06_000692 [Ceratobasidium sp. 370]|nr:hypothetical protein FRC06_000692 [Ceratobasidium sp. 370]